MLIEAGVTSRTRKECALFEKSKAGTRTEARNQPFNPIRIKPRTRKNFENQIFIKPEKSIVFPDISCIKKFFRDEDASIHCREARNENRFYFHR